MGRSHRRRGYSIELRGVLSFPWSLFISPSGGAVIDELGIDIIIVESRNTLRSWTNAGVVSVYAPDEM